MANLPDINTANVGIIAFWNAHDHRTNGTSIDPTDCIPTFSTYTVYDNGIDGKIDPQAKGWGGSDRQINVRVKNDGWFVAWIDRTNTFDYPNKLASDFGESASKGYYDILWDWFDPDVNISDTYTTLSYMIYKLYDTLTNKAEFNFAVSDVGHYCYEYPNANVLTLMDVFTTYPPEPATQTGKVQYTSGTTLYYASVAGAGNNFAHDTSRTYQVKFADNTIVDFSATQSFRYGTADILANNWMPNPLTDYSLYVYSATSWSYPHGSIIIIWA